MYWTHPGEEKGFAIDDQFFVGSTGLLVKPIIEKDQVSTDVYIPDDEVYYDYFTYSKLSTHKAKTVAVDAPIEAIPVLMRGGHIFPRRDVPRRSTQLMKYDDYTLVVVLGKDLTAKGELYVDDGDSFDYQEGQYIHRVFEFHQRLLTSSPSSPDEGKNLREGDWMKRFHDVSFDKIILVGVPTSWEGRTEVEVKSEGKTHKVPLQFNKGDGAQAPFAVVGRLGIRVGAEWEIDFA
jgi:alpha 1,3-glucosidase